MDRLVEGGRVRLGDAEEKRSDVDEVVVGAMGPRGPLLGEERVLPAPKVGCGDAAQVELVSVRFE